MRSIFFLLIACFSLAAQGPTLDFSEARRTVPWRVRTDEPGACTPSEIYYNTTTAKLRVCSATNVWSDIAPVTVLCRQTTDVANTGSTSETATYSCLIPAGTLGANSIIEWHAINSNAANAGTCTYYVHISNAATAGTGTIIQSSGAQSANRSVEQWGKCANRASTSSQVCSGHSINPTNIATTTAAGTASYATASVAIYVNFSAQNSNGADTCTLNMADVTIYP